MWESDFDYYSDKISTPALHHRMLTSLCATLMRVPVIAHLGVRSAAPKGQRLDEQSRLCSKECQQGMMVHQFRLSDQLCHRNPVHPPK